MQTKIYDVNELNEIVNALNDGQIIAFPTDTVFGLGCVYDLKEAILKMLKELDSKTYLVITSCYYNRPNHPPMPVFIQKLEGKDSSCIYGFGLV